MTDSDFIVITQEMSVYVRLERPQGYGSFQVKMDHGENFLFFSFAEGVHSSYLSSPGQIPNFTVEYPSC